MGNKKDYRTFDTLSWWLIGIAIVLAIFAFFSPLIFTREGLVDFTNTGPPPSRRALCASSPQNFRATLTRLTLTVLQFG